VGCCGWSVVAAVCWTMFVATTPKVTWTSLVALEFVSNCLRRSLRPAAGDVYRIDGPLALHGLGQPIHFPTGVACQTGSSTPESSDSSPNVQLENSTRPAAGTAWGWLIGQAIGLTSHAAKPVARIAGIHCKPQRRTVRTAGTEQSGVAQHWPVIGGLSEASIDELSGLGGSGGLRCWFQKFRYSVL
jgi:hypothetical protein